MEELLACELPGGVLKRKRFEWRYGKCDVRHWTACMSRLAKYLEAAAVEARARGDGGDERARETFAGVNWIMDFMHEIVENYGEGASFAHGHSVVRWMEFNETLENALRLLAAATQRSVVGRTTRHEFFTSDAFKRIRFMLGKIEEELRPSSSIADIDGRVETEETTDDETAVISARGKYVDRTASSSSGYTYEVDVTYDSEVRTVRSRARGVDANGNELSEAWSRKLPSGLTLSALIDHLCLARMFEEDKIDHIIMKRFGVDREHFFDGMATALFTAKMQLYKCSLARSKAGREMCARLVLLAQQTNLHLGKSREPNDFEVFVENAQSNAIWLLDMMQVDIGVKAISVLRRDATNCLSAYTNERLCGFQVCQIIRRSAGRGILHQCVSAMASNLVSAQADTELSFDLIRDARSIMHLVGILSTSTPGCATIREADILWILVSLLKFERFEALPLLVDVVHTIESYLDFHPNAVPAFREIQGVELLSKRMRQEALAAVEELRISGHLEETPDRKRKADSLSSLDDAGASVASTSEVQRKYVDYDRRVLLKALMRTLAYTSFSYGGRARVSLDSPMEV